MEFGVQLYHPEYRAHRDAVREAEALGFSSTFLPDHFIEEWTGAGSLDTPLYDCLSVLAALAEATETIRLGTHVVCTLFRHPALLAKMWATMDHISGGRVLAGVGAGWTRKEFDMMGIEFPPVSTRLRIMEENIRLLRAFWTEPRVNFSGEFYRITDGVCEPKPVQRPHPPLMLGGNGKGVLRRAAQLGDIMNITLSLGPEGELDYSKVPEFTGDAFRRRVEFLRDETEKAGRPRDAVRVSCSVFQFMLTDSPAQTTQVRENFAGLYGLPLDHVRHMPLALVGTKDEIVEEIAYRRDAWEVDQLVLIAQGHHDWMRAFGEQILPACR